MAQYNNRSPWSKTKLQPGYLDLLSIRPIAAEDDDSIYVIEPQYNYRPDLLAYDIYGSSKLWWVFAQRNMDVINDPIFDFRSGTEIKLPKKEGLFTVLGI